jgi:hypothetical protein
MISNALSASILIQSTVERQQDLNDLKLDSRECRHANIRSGRYKHGMMAVCLALASVKTISQVSATKGQQF